MKRVIIGAGSCIIQAVIKQFETIPGLTDKAELHLSQILPGGRERLAPALLARCSILIEEAAPWQKSGTLTTEERAHLPEGCVTLTVPTLHFNSLWPLMAEDPRNVPEPGAPYGRIPFGMGDRLALKVVQSEPDPEKRRAAYDAAGLRGVNLARSHELEIRNCFAREQGCDVRVAAYVMAHFREKRLYYTHNHPTGELMFFVLAQLYALPALRDLIKLPYDQLVTAARAWADTSNVFGGEEAPVHPDVAAYFGLGWWKADHKYAWMDEARSFDEWIDWYLRYQPRTTPAEPEPAPGPAAGPSLPRGLFLDTLLDQGRLTGALELEPAAQISRPVPFVAIGLDSAVARHGAALTDPAAGRYRASRTLLAPLRGAQMLGVSGLVVHEGAILGDSFRNLAPDGVVAAVEPEAVVLRPGILPARRVEGRAFCGFAPGWQDQAHWLIGGLPRLVAFIRMHKRDRALRLVLPTLAPGSLHAQCVALLGIPEEQIIQIGAAEALEFEELSVLSALDLWQVSPFSRQAAHELASALALTGVAVASAERIYLRSAAVVGRMVNGDAVADALASLGFSVLDFDGLDVAQRVAVMRRAQVVVGEHGPNMANIFFCAPGTRVLEIFGPSAPQPMYWSVAAACGLQYGYAVGNLVPTEGQAAPGRGESYTLPPDHLAAALSAMLALG